MKKKLQALKYKISHYIDKKSKKKSNELTRSGSGYIKRREGLLSTDLAKAK